MTFLSEVSPIRSSLWLPGQPASPYTAATDAAQTAALATGLYQNAVNVILNGTTQYGSAALASAFKTANVTLMAWVKPTAVSAQQAIVDAEPINAAAGVGVFLRLTAAGVAQFAVGTGSAFVGATGVIPISAGAWTHIAGTYDGTNVKVFVNGVQDVSAASAAIVWTDGSGFPTPATLFVGAYKANSAGSGNQVPDSLWFGGELCELRWYASALTAQQIVDASRNVFFDNDTLIAAWPCSEGSGTTLTDQSGNGRNIALAATPSWGTDNAY